MSSDKSFRERISYEDLLLWQIDRIVKAITNLGGRLEPYVDYATIAYMGANILVKLLVPELRNEVVECLKDVEDKISFTTYDLGGSVKPRPRNKKIVRKGALNKVYEYASEIVRCTIDVLHKHGMLLREQEQFQGEAI